MTHTRRDFLKLAGFTSVALGSATLLSPASLYAAANAPTREELVAALARGMFPHDRVPPSLYNRIAADVLQQASASSETAGVVDQGVARVRELAAPDVWTGLDDEQRVAILKELDGDPFFGLLRGTAVRVLYRDPEVWRLVGYGGNALQQGGYPESFNDIDWLPET